MCFLIIPNPFIFTIIFQSIPSNLRIEWDTIFLPHSNHSLLHSKLHAQRSSSFQNPASHKYTFFIIEFIYSLRNLAFKLTYHLSSQNFILWSIPNFHLMLLLNQLLLCSFPHVLLISFHYHKSCYPSLDSSSAFLKLYLISKSPTKVQVYS